MMKRIFLLLILCLAFLTPCLAQKPYRNSSSNWWINIPNAPLVFDFEPVENSFPYEPSEESLHDKQNHQYWVGLRNVSSKSIYGYELGCVIQRGRKIKILNRGYKTEISDSGIVSKEFTSVFNAKSANRDEAEIREFCKNSKLAVLKVEFDGTRWTVPKSLISR